MFKISLHFILVLNHKHTKEGETNISNSDQTSQFNMIKYLLEWLFLICCMVNWYSDSAIYSHKMCALKVGIYLRFSRRFCGHLTKLPLKHEGKIFIFSKALNTDIIFSTGRSFSDRFTIKKRAKALRRMPAVEEFLKVSLVNTWTTWITKTFIPLLQVTWPNILYIWYEWVAQYWKLH